MRKFVCIAATALLLNGFVYGQESLIFQKKEKYGLQEGGRTLLKPKYENLRYLGQNLYAAKIKGQYGVISQKGLVAIIPMYDDLMPFGDDTFLAKKDEKWGLINRMNQEILPIQYTGFNFIDEYLCEIKSQEKVGYINKYGEIVIPTLYDEIKPFITSYFLVKEDGKLGIIDYSGKMVIPSEYDGFEKLGDSDSYQLKKGNKIGILDPSLKIEIEARYDSIQDCVLGKYLVQDGKIGFYTSTGKLIEPVFTKISFYQPEFGLAIVRTNNKLGFVTSSGTYIEPMYENMSRFSDGGIAFVEKEGKLMAINLQGKELTLQEIMGAGPSLPTPDNLPTPR